MCIHSFDRTCMRESRTNVVGKIFWLFVDRIWPDFYHCWTLVQGWTHPILGSRVKVTVGSNMPQNAFFGLVLVTYWWRHNSRQGHNLHLVCYISTTYLLNVGLWCLFVQSAMSDEVELTTDGSDIYISRKTEPFIITAISLTSASVKNES